MACNVVAVLELATSQQRYHVTSLASVTIPSSIAVKPVPNGVAAKLLAPSPAQIEPNDHAITTAAGLQRQVDVGASLPLAGRPGRRSRVNSPPS